MYRRFSSEELLKFIKELLSERRGFIPIKKDLPSVIDIKEKNV